MFSIGTLEPQHTLFCPNIFSLCLNRFVVVCRFIGSFSSPFGNTPFVRYIPFVSFTMLRGIHCWVCLFMVFMVFLCVVRVCVWGFCLWGRERGWLMCIVTALVFQFRYRSICISACTISQIPNTRPTLAPAPHILICLHPPTCQHHALN